MINLMDATQTAVFAALTARAELTALSQVTQHVIQDMLSDGPITRIGKIESTPIGGKDQQAEEITVDVETVYRGESQAAVLAIMHQQRLALEDQVLVLEGIEFDTPEWAGGMVDGPANDGVTYAGIQTFVIISQPA